ncbi:MAG TPA: nuclear transport factor 2 family protein [Gemmatimonadaceae bacterium]|nr:nuclear transport factor 2 family protein [Gemmatimonadaceae bacterium]
MAAEIDELRNAWIAAVARRDPSAVADLLTDDYEVWSGGAPALKGPAAAAAAMGAALARFDIEQSLEVVETVVSGDWAFERGIERMTLTPRGGGDVQRFEQRAFLVMRRDADGRWRYARGMTTAMPK